jgi:hypothetical protein
LVKTIDSNSVTDLEQSIRNKPGLLLRLSLEDDDDDDDDGIYPTTSVQPKNGLEPCSMVYS